MTGVTSGALLSLGQDSERERDNVVKFTISIRFNR